MEVEERTRGIKLTKGATPFFLGDNFSYAGFVGTDQDDDPHPCDVEIQLSHIHGDSCFRIDFDDLVADFIGAHEEGGIAGSKLDQHPQVCKRGEMIVRGLRDAADRLEAALKRR